MFDESEIFLFRQRAYLSVLLLRQSPPQRFPIDHPGAEVKICQSVPGFPDSYLWGAKPVNIPFIFLWPSLLLYGQLEFLCGQLFTFYIDQCKILH